jgi:hypothetical protein
MTENQESFHNSLTNPVAKDVLMGRGGQSNNHPGNKHYQSVLETHAWEYSQLMGRDAKTKFAWGIFHQLKKEGIRFLRFDRATGEFLEAQPDDARKKISQRLRELALELREHQSEGDTSDEGVFKSEAIEDTSEEDVFKSELIEALPIPLGCGRLKPSNTSVEAFTVDLEMSELLTSCLLEDAEPAKEESPSSYHPEALLNSSIHSDTDFYDAAADDEDVEDDADDDDFPHLSWEEIDSEQAVCGSLGDLSACDLSTVSPAPLVPLTFGISFVWPDKVPFNADADNQVLNGAEANQNFPDFASWQDSQLVARIPRDNKGASSSQHFQEFAGYPHLETVTGIPQYQEVVTSNTHFRGFASHHELQRLNSNQLFRESAGLQDVKGVTSSHISQGNSNNHKLHRINQGLDVVGSGTSRTRAQSLPGQQDSHPEVSFLQHVQGFTSRQVLRGNASNQVRLQQLNPDFRLTGPGMGMNRAHSLPGRQGFPLEVATLNGLQGVQVSQGSSYNQNLQHTNHDFHVAGPSVSTNRMHSSLGQQAFQGEEPAAKRRRESLD